MLKIDFVVMWVDGADKKWLAQKQKYELKENGKTTAKAHHYRDWEILKYMFRGFEEYARWVNKIYFVTCGQHPSWLQETDKLKFVDHKDFMPAEILPTFSANSIELNLHRIKGLSEHFVYFNDDMLLTDYVSPEDFFDIKTGLPKDTATMNRTTPLCDTGVMPYIVFNDVAIINKHFSKKQVLRRDFGKWFNPAYGFQSFMRNLMYKPFEHFSGMYFYHIPSSFKKSAIKEVWQKETEVLEKTCANRFRKNTDVNQYLFKAWQLAKGEFSPRNTNKLSQAVFVTNNQQATQAAEVIKSRQHKLICINDSDSIEDFDKAKRDVVEAFEAILPEKSIFEK